MGKPHKTKEEILQKKRLAARQRRERIKNDPVLYQQAKEKEKKRYQKRKEEKKLLPVSEMTRKDKKKAQKRNRDNFKAYYKRKKLREKLATIEEEVLLEEDPVELADDIEDPLKPPSPTTLQDTRYLLRSDRTAKEVFQVNFSKNHNTTKVDKDELCQPSTKNWNTTNTSAMKESSNSLDYMVLSAPLLSRARPPTETVASSDTSILSDTAVTSDSVEYEENKDTSDIFNIQEPLLRTKVTSNFTVSSKKTVNKFKSVTSSSLRFRRYKYKTNKEMLLLRKKIEDLKNINEKYRRQVCRLKSVKTLTIPRTIHKKQNESNIVHDNIRGKTIEQIKRDVKIFIEQDENSRICSGKREFISKNKIKKQKRYLTDTMQNLHKKFDQTHTYKISYSTFCKLRPFWVVIPDCRARDTCLCKIHANMDLIVSSLKRFDIINESSAHKVLSSLCCDTENVKCLERSCIHCVYRTIHFKEFDNSTQIVYWHWMTKKVTYTKYGKEKTSTQTVKEKVIANPKDVIEKFDFLLLPYMKHCANKVAQNNYIKHLKANLPENDCMVQVDYSENYNTKYAEEIQSFHFGGSRKQITLHTSVIYYKKNGILITQSFCTLSTSLRHDAVAVWSHLIPILNFIKSKAPLVNAIHFVSDSPTGQYRNRNMFYVISKLAWDFPDLQVIGWNYTEAGHGKSSADGVGATVKRTADRLVAQGCDINDIETLFENLKANLKGVILSIVQESDIFQRDLLIPKKLREFKGTLKIHQVVWSSTKPHMLAMRKLSCDSQDCVYNPVKCEHGNHHGFYSFATTDSWQYNTPTIHHQNSDQLPILHTVTPGKPMVLSNQLLKRPENKNNLDISRPETFNPRKHDESTILSNRVMQPPKKQFLRDWSILKIKKNISTPKTKSNRSLQLTEVLPSSSNYKSNESDKLSNESDKENTSIHLSETDSFWVPVSPVDFSTMPSFLKNTELLNSGTENKKSESEESDYDIF